MSDNELDNLFKEAAEGFKPPHDDEAWKQMAARLDRHAVTPTRFWNWKSISSAALVGCVVFTAGWYLATQEDTTPSDGANIPIQSNEQSDHTGQKPVQDQQENPQTVNPGKDNIGSNPRLPNETNNVNGDRKTSVKNHPVSEREFSETAPAGGLSATHETSMPDAEKNRTHAVPQPAEQPEEEFAQGLVLPQSPSHAAQSRVLAEKDSVAEQDNHPEVDSLAAPGNPQPDAGSTGAGISLKAMVAPDFSSVGWASVGKPGINYGLLVGYSFNSRWSVYTGVIASKKVYSSTDINESYTSGGHPYPVKELEGDCRIVDIPVNVYYTFFPERSFSLRAGLGFSSYIMTRESYVYCVNNYGTDVYYNQEVKGRNKEWFKVMNLSVMVAKKITPRLSAEFEPFVKTPLAGVGEGKVSLVSLGAFLNLKLDLTTHVK